MKTYEFDVVTENVTLEETIEKLFGIEGIIAVQTLQGANGPEGWPTIKVTLNESPEAISKLSEIFSNPEDCEL